MKNYSKITENKDILTKEYADSKYAKINDIPTSTTVSGWGFTKNTGTVTSVAVKMNGSEKGKVTSSGTIDLGTVITSHQDISGLMPKSGGTFTGNVTFSTVPKVGNSPLALKSDIPTIPTLAKVATTGSYTDLSNTPTIPTVNNGTLTIKQNGTTVQTFSANQSGNVTANITVPTFSFSNGVLTITT